MKVQTVENPATTEGVFAVGRSSDDAPRTDLIEPDVCREAILVAVTKALNVYEAGYTGERATEDGLDAGEEVLAKAVAEAEARAAA